MTAMTSSTVDWASVHEKVLLLDADTRYQIYEAYRRLRLCPHGSHGRYNHQCLEAAMQMILPEPKQSSSEVAAAEYDEIIAMQDLISPQ